MGPLIRAGIIFFVTSVSLPAQADRDFSGKWYLDTAASDLRISFAESDPILIVDHQESVIRCSNGGTASWTYKLNGDESVAKVNGERRSSEVKWEGSALLINTLVSGTQNYTVMDRWRLSNDRSALNISRQVMVGTNEKEGRLVYRRDSLSRRSEAAAPAPSTAATTPTTITIAEPVSESPSRRPEPAEPTVREYVVPSGTRILLSLQNAVDTKHSHAGDRIYLRTAFPVYQDNRLIIPQGSTVTGTVSDAKEPGRNGGKKKGELYIRFDTLTLPNGVTRDFRSRLSSAGEAKGKVDRDEGKVTGESDKGGEARTVATTAGMGATIGGIAGAASGHTLPGVGIGGAAGAAAGLAGVLLKRGPDATLPRGTNVEMVLDRDLRYRADELR